MRLKAGLFLEAHQFVSDLTLEHEVVARFRSHNVAKIYCWDSSNSAGFCQNGIHAIPGLTRGPV